MQFSIFDVTSTCATRCQKVIRSYIYLPAALFFFNVAPLAHAQAPGVTPNEIHIGGSAALSGSFQGIAKSFRDGAQLHFDQVNKTGGIHRRKIRFTVLDDGYDVERTKKNITQLVDQDQVLALFGVFGTPTSLAALPIADKSRVPFFTPFTGADSLRAVKSEMLYTINASYRDEAVRMVSHLAQTSVADIAIVYQNNAFGQSGRQAATENISRLKLNLVSDLALEVNGSNASEVARNLAAKSPAAVLVFTAGKLTADFAKAFVSTGNRAQVFLLSVADVETLRKELGAKSRGLIVTQTLPPPWLPTLPVVAEYRRAGNLKRDSEANYTHFLGYMSARVLVESLRRTGRDLSREKFLRSLQNSRQYDLGGYIVDFSNGRQHGSNYVDITMIGADGRFVR
jgi:branched-chain amino acid transport system substrate-binding protein